MLGQVALERESRSRVQLDVGGGIALRRYHQVIIDEAKLPPLSTDELFLVCHWVLPHFLSSFSTFIPSRTVECFVLSQGITVTLTLRMNNAASLRFSSANVSRQVVVEMRIP